MITPIAKPFGGERVVGLSPSPAARVTDWNRRLNLFTGRALSATALTNEQENRNGRAALLGQAVSPGVVLGLEAALDVQNGTTFVNIGPGYGICASGEDVFVGAMARVPLHSVPVYATAALLDGVASVGTGALAARRLGPSLDEAITKGVAIPKAGILVLQPSQVDQLANFDAADPCVEDPTSAAFADEQLLDGARLIYYAWPDEWLLLPASGPQWRNRLAYAIFGQEATNDATQGMPWEQIGLPLALIGFDPLDNHFQPLFLDRHAVVREGGRAKRRTPLTPNSGHDILWQARIQQFAEHVTSVTAATAPAAEFRYIPPAGLLPVSALQFLTGAQAGTTRVSGTSFFPGTFTVQAVPAPLEQLDLIARSCGSLAEIDTFTPGHVTVVVPVPQAWYEPDLLKVLQIAPSFQQAVNQFDHERSIWLKRRADVRAATVLLTRAATGKITTFPFPDPDAVEAETLADSQIDASIPEFTDPELDYGVSLVGGTFTVTGVTDLKTALTAMPGVKDEVPQLDALGLRQFAQLLQTKADTANDHIDLGFLRVQTDIYRTRQKMLSQDAATRLAVSPALATIAQGISAAASKEELQAFLTSAKISLTGTTTTAPALEAPAAAVVEKPPTTFLKANVPLLAAANPTLKQAVQTRTVAGAATLFNANANVALKKATSVVDVAAGRPIVGGGYDLRTTSVVERLQDPPSSEVKTSTLASKFDAISTFKNASMIVSDIEIPGFIDATGKEARKKFSDITPANLDEILAGTHDPLLSKPDEANIFAAGVRAMENTIDILRLMESRVAVYRQAAQLCLNQLSAVNGNSTAANARLQAIANSLGQARHDVAFAKALMAEEQTRIAGINQRRDQIVTSQVQFLAYFRPRTVEARNDLPMRSIEPGLSAAVIPTCLSRNLAAPDELRAYVNLLREAPVNWFRFVPILIDRFDRFDVLQTVLQNSKLRAGFKLAQSVATPVTTVPGPLAPEIFRVFSGQQLVMNQARQATAQIDLTSFAGISWAETRDRAAALLSIGDLVDLGHYHPTVPRVSAAEIENILKVSACLYSDFTGVLPVIRLNWAERLVQLGASLNLSNLSALPRWGEVPALERKEMQAIVDWLFSRINSGQPAAVSHINDLVRIAILLASHAPVADIIAGDVIRDTRISPGIRIDLSADLSRVRTGMHVLIYQSNQPVARAVVEDLSPGVATARVLTTTSTSITVARAAKVQFATADAFDRNPLTAGLL
jgi:antitoxin (DNA-binding transcriptional repressor) of toxin-antitoxin stability system